jgi:cob(I)alamin adenosyltransferase
MDNATSTAIGFVEMWCAVITVIGILVTAASRTIRKRIQQALKDVEDSLVLVKAELSTEKTKNKVILVYARRLYDAMMRGGITPPEAPAEFFD